MTQENDHHNDKIGDAITAYQDLLFSQDPDSKELAALYQMMWETIDEAVESGMVVDLSGEVKPRTLDRPGLFERIRQLLRWNRH